MFIDEIKKNLFKYGEYILSLLLIFLNVLAYEKNINQIIFFIFSSVIVAPMFMLLLKKNNIMSTCLQMMCFTWPISWINIFGKGTGELQISWFYLFGLLFALSGIYYVLKSYKNYALKDLKKDLLLFITVVLMCIYNFVPLFLSNDIKEGFGDFMTILFFVSILLVSLLYSKKYKGIDDKKILNSLVYSCLISSIFIVIQFILLKFFSISFLNSGISGSFDKTKYQIGAGFLFEDASSALIMLGVGVIASLYITKNKCVNLLSAAFIVIALSLTGRRTAPVCLVPIICLMCLFGLKGKNKKIQLSLISLMGVSIALVVVFLGMSRPYTSIMQLIDDNGRFENYIAVLKNIPTNVFGIGYGDQYLASTMADGIIPHNTILRWFAMGGWILGIGMSLTIFYLIYEAYKQKKNMLFWIVAYSFLASNVIPDILNARFFVIPCAMILLSNETNRKEVENSETTDNIYTNIQ